MPLTFAPASWRWTRALVALVLGAAALAAAVAVATAGAPASPLAAPSPGSAPGTSVNAPTLAGLPAGRSVGVIVQMAAGGTAADAAALVVRHGGLAGTPLDIIHAVAARMTAGAARALAADPSVKAVSLDAAVRSTSKRIDRQQLEVDFLKTVRAARAWDRGDNATGKGVGVAVVDTGIAGDLPDFRVSADDHTSRVIASAVENPDATTARDLLGHGTHVAGLIAGNGGALDDNDPALGKHYGVAPDANLIAVKIADDQGGTTLADVVAGLQFVVDHKDDLNIKVVNLSLNSTVAQSRDTDPLDAAVEVAWLNGITVVTAAGNRGTAPDAVDYAPANDPYVISVGATDDSGTPRTSDDTVPAWSSSGTTQDGFAKPEILAPGAHVVATLAPGSAYGAECPSCIVDGRYLRLGGTSMAAAVVSGAAADVLSAHPDWTPDQVKAALVRRSRGVQGTAIGEVNVAGAIRYNGNRPANVGLQPSALLPSYDPTSASFDRLSWTRLSWTRLSWTRLSWTSVGPGDPKAAPWSRLSWTCACDPAAADAGAPPSDDGQSGDPAVDPSRLSWTRLSWTRLSWTASFTK